jgi:mannitol/fructose-specific phosphotransferase system IIA component (Ntr-type)
MSFVDRLRPDVIRVAPPWRTFDDTIAGLVATLATAGLLAPARASAAVDAVRTRETAASTALLDIHAGVPHARLAGIDAPIVALALSSDGLYEAVPTVAIQIVALVLSPPDAGTHHLQILSGIATLLRSPELRTDLVSAPDAQAVLTHLRHHAREMPR